MKSKFSFGGFLPILIGLPLAALMVLFFVLIAKNDVQIPPLKALPLLIILMFTLIWLFWGEFRTKMIKVTIDGDVILVRRFGGLSTESEFLISEFDGFKISRQSYGARGIKEYLYLMKGNRKIVKISEAYHKNYQNLKTAIQLRAKDLGYENFSFLDELKEIFI
jgi:hypothetical protein